MQSTFDLIPDLPSARRIRRSLRSSPYFPGRPLLADEPRFWSGLAIGLGLGAVTAALFSPRRGRELRAGLRDGVTRLASRMPSRRRGRIEAANVGAPAHTLEQSIEIERPVEEVYARWTRFEDFPKFMNGVVEVRREPGSARRLHWKARVDGVEREWDAEITEQAENQRVAWRSIDGKPNAGVVTFHRLSDDRCKLMLQLEHEPESWIEAAGDRLGALRRRVHVDLARFRDLVEGRLEP